MSASSLSPPPTTRESSDNNQVRRSLGDSNKGSHKSHSQLLPESAVFHVTSLPAVVKLLYESLPNVLRPLIKHTSNVDVLQLVSEINYYKTDDETM